MLDFLSNAEQQQFYENLNYMNTEELRSICDQLHIPYHIHLETVKGIKKTADCDRKGVIITRLKEYIKQGKAGAPTLYQQSVMGTDNIKSSLPIVKCYTGNLKASIKV